MTFHGMPTVTRIKSRPLAADFSTSFLFLFTLVMFLTWTCYGHEPGTSGQSIILSSLAAPLRKLPPQAQPSRHTAFVLHDKSHTSEDVTEETTTPQGVSEVPPRRCCSLWAAPFDVQFYEWGG
ncbi:uncharacterized protein LOC125045459 [Penaeus chinensis]|uniref:uncharacterized protein LOC125045459 n=1 Tax=Penaeus chinensis TaxID=139456 RepID=UPI001FB6BA61|nr:uncharacterized protein LOC125045459 [Penaeus chinensis]